MAKPLEATRVAAFGLTDSVAVAAFALGSDTPVYGLGEKGGALNKRGQLVASRVEDALGVNTDLSYKNTPFAWGTTNNGCWGVLTHTTVDVMHGVGYAQWSNRSYVVVSNEPQLDLFLFAADTPTEVIAGYHHVTGRPENVPLWSLGAWVSRAYYKNEADIMATAHEFRERKFPVDVITFDGRAWQDTPTRFHFNFDPSRYPDPKRVNDQLKALGYKICCWEYPLVSVNHPDYRKYEQSGYFLKRVGRQRARVRSGTRARRPRRSAPRSRRCRRRVWSISPILRRTPGGATNTKICGLRESTSSRATSVNKCPLMRVPTTATRVRVFTTSTRTSTTAACMKPRAKPSATRPACGAAPAG
jgi:hypothetical protein